MSASGNISSSSVSAPGSGATGMPDMRHLDGARQKLLAEAGTWLGVNYRYGGHGKDGTDCSGMVMEIFRSAADISLPRNSREQYKYCKDIKRKELTPGDLEFFANNLRTGRIGHVGIYIGEGKIIHATTSRGVVISSLTEDYWDKHYAASGRVEELQRMSGRHQPGQAGRKRKKDGKTERHTEAPEPMTEPAPAEEPGHGNQWFD